MLALPRLCRVATTITVNSNNDTSSGVNAMLATGMTARSFVDHSIGSLLPYLCDVESIIRKFFRRPTVEEPGKMNRGNGNYPERAKALLLAAMALGSTACATPQVAEQTEAHTRAQDFQLASAAYGLREDMFRARSSALLEEISLLKEYPGWKEMATIITETASVTHPKGSKAAKARESAELKKWANRWSASPGVLLSKYSELVSRSTAALKERDELLEALPAVQVKEFLYAQTDAETCTGSRNFNTCVQTYRALVQDSNHNYGSTEAWLDSFGVDSIGLLAQTSDRPTKAHSLRFSDGSAGPLPARSLGDRLPKARPKVGSV